MNQTSPAVFDQLLDYRRQLLTRLERQPAEVADMLAGFPEPEWFRPRALEGRSLHQLMAHVRDVEQLAFLPRVRRILTEDRPTLEPFTSHDWSDADYQPAEPLTHILARWSQARAEVLDLLPAPDHSGWSLTGFHPPSGQRTLQWWAERIYNHVRQHLPAASAH